MDEAPVLLTAVFDTNILVSGTIVPAGIPARLLDAWYRGQIMLITSPEQLGELSRTLRRPVFARKYGIDDAVVNTLINRLRRFARLVVPPDEIAVSVRDPDDERILVIALNGQAGYLVTGDDDLLVLADEARLGSLRIVTVRAFAQVLEQL